MNHKIIIDGEDLELTKSIDTVVIESFDQELDSKNVNMVITQGGEAPSPSGGGIININTISHNNIDTNIFNIINILKDVYNGDGAASEATTKSSKEFTLKKDDMLICAVIHRSSITSVNADFVIREGTSNQYISLYKHIAITDETYTFTVRQTNSVRLGIVCFLLNEGTPLFDNVTTGQFSTSSVTISNPGITNYYIAFISFYYQDPGSNINSLSKTDLVANYYTGTSGPCRLSYIYPKIFTQKAKMTSYTITSSTNDSGNGAYIILPIGE